MARDRDRLAGQTEARGAPPDPARAHLARLEAARLKVARLVVENPRLAPIFLRLEREIAWERAKLSADPLARARAVIAQNAIGASSPAMVDSLPPSP